MGRMIDAFLSASLIACVTILDAGTVRAQEFSAVTFPQRDGEAIFRTVCQGCHMPDAKGAVGAAAYPALARNSKLKVAIYPSYVIVNGQRAMPSFGASLDDEQIANIVTYIRTHFGNHYTDKVKLADVKAARPVATASRAQP